MENTTTSRVTVDLHVDTPWQEWKNRVGRNGEPTYRVRDVTYPVFALYLSDAVLDNMDPKEIEETILWQREFTTTVYGVEHFGIEGARILAEAPDLLESLNTIEALRYVTLLHNWDNIYGSSSLSQIDNGLSYTGSDLISELNKQNILVDVSHCGDRTAMDCIEYSSQPILATHSGCRALVDHPRNLSDDLIRSIAATGGMIGVPFATRFIGHNYSAVADHIDHIVQLVGPTHVGVGSDIDGADTIVGSDQWEEVVVDGLLRLGYSEVDIDAIAGGNAIRVLGIGEL